MSIVWGGEMATLTSANLLYGTLCTNEEQCLLKIHTNI